MCGRARCSLDPDAVRKHAEVPQERWKDSEKFKASYNVSPGRYMPIVKMGSDDKLELYTMKWGLVPSFTKSGTRPDHYRMFNARSETLMEKPIFKRLLARNRCIVVVNGFYEWHKQSNNKKQPYYVSLGEEEVMKFAGLYDSWTDEASGETMHSFAILTTDSSKRFAWLHSRMPVLLRTPHAQSMWLESTDWSKLEQFLVPYTEEDLIWHPVTSAMSKASYDTPECSKDVRKKGIGAFFKPKTPKKAGNGVKKEEGGDVKAMGVIKMELGSEVKTESVDVAIKMHVKNEVDDTEKKLDAKDEVDGADKKSHVKDEVDYAEKIVDGKDEVDCAEQTLDGKDELKGQPMSGVEESESESEGMRITRRKRQCAMLTGEVPRAPPPSPERQKRQKTIASFFSP